MNANVKKFVIRTTEGLLIGPFFSYEVANDFADASRYSIDDIYQIVWPREDMLGPKVANTAAADRLHGRAPAFPPEAI